MRWLSSLMLSFCCAAGVCAADGYQGPSFQELDRRTAEGKPLTVVFLGGSLTWGANASNPQLTSARALVGDYLVRRYPKSSVRLVDAAIGGTGSQLGLFRLERDVLRLKPDLVFVDCTVNDGVFMTSPEMLWSYETILRTLLKHHIPVVQVFFGIKANYLPDAPVEPIARRKQHLALNRYYRLGAGDTYGAVRDALKSGKLTLDTAYMPSDSTHPDDPGYAAQAAGIIAGYEAAVKSDLRPTLPEKPYYGTFSTVKRADLTQIALPAGWRVVDTQRTGLWFDGQASRWQDRLIEADAKSAPLKFKTRGSLLGLFGEGNSNSLNFKVRLDGKYFDAKGKLVDKLPDGATEKVWDASTRAFKPLAGNLFIWRLIGERLADTDHEVEIIPVADEKSGATGFLRFNSVCFAGDLVPGDADPQK